MKSQNRLAYIMGFAVFMVCLLLCLIGSADAGSGWLGVSIQDLTTGLKEAMDYDRDVGVLVNEVEEDSPAEKARIKEGDIIIEYDGTTIPSTGSLIRKVRATDPGDEVEVVVVRKGIERRLTVIIGEVPTAQTKLREREDEKKPHIVKQIEEKSGWLGVHLQDLTDQLGEYFGVSEGEGALVSEVIKESPAEKAGIKAGDVIVEYDGDEIDGVDELIDAVGETEVGEEVEIDVMRDRRMRTIVVEIGGVPKKYSQTKIDVFKVPSPKDPSDIRQHEDYLKKYWDQLDTENFKDNIWRLRVPKTVEGKEIRELKKRLEKLEREIEKIKDRL